LIAKHDELNKSNIKELVRDFDVAIEKATRQGKLRELKLIENEKKDFLANPDSLPSSQFMLSSRTKYETNWWINRQALEKDLKIKIVQLVKEKNISVADKTQAVLEKVEKMKLVPTDVSVGLIGKWKVSMIGKTKQGSIIDYKPVWEFKQDAVIHSIDDNISRT